MKLSASAAAAAAIIGLALLFPAPSHAQKLYKCQKDGKVFFSNQPCTGAGSVQSSSPLGSKVTTLAGPSPGRAYSPSDKELLGLIQKELPSLTERCESGEEWVCALLDCVLKADPQACARAEGRLSGEGWRERSRRENKLRRDDPRLGAIVVTETELIIECSSGSGTRHVYWTDEGKAYLRDGVPEPGSSGRTGIRSPGKRFATLEEAAAAACAKPPDGGGGKETDGTP